MRNWFVYIALVLSLSILVWLGRIYIEQNKLQIQYTKDVEHTYEVIITLHNCEQLLLDAEASQRGYFLTHINQFKQYYEDAVSKIDSVVNHLSHVISDNASQRVNFKLMKPAITERIESLKSSLVLKGNEKDFVEILRKGKSSMDRIRFYIGMMEKEEYNLLHYRNKEKNRYQELNFSFLKYTFFFACLICISSMILIIRELRIRIRSQRMLEQSLFELKQSNDEIEQVSFVLSHDLQEPLRKIRTLSTLLTKRYTNSITPEEKDVLARIDKSTVRMHGLLDNLTDFTNLINRSEKLSHVNLETIFTQAFNKVMAHSEAELNIMVTLPTIKGYELQLTLLFTQLLSNSLQYRYPGRKIVIDVTCQIKDTRKLNKPWQKATAKQYYQLTIQDNGIGFDNIFRERIFMLFQRLHSQTEYSGKGIGLTIARRVMANHYGYIEASGIKGKGASFTMSFPIT